VSNLSLLARIADSGHSGADVRRRDHRAREVAVEISRGATMELFGAPAEEVEELVDSGLVSAELIGVDWRRLRISAKGQLRLEAASGPPTPEVPLAPDYVTGSPY
jgi:hypothetical protein